jgi:hypothetical protein
MNQPEPRRGGAGPIIAVVLACLFFVPLAPLAGAIMGAVLLARTPKDQPRSMAVLASVLGGLVFLGLQVAPTIFLVDFTRALMSDMRFAEAKLNVPKLADQIQSYARVNHQRMPPATDWAPPGEPRCPFAQHFAGEDPIWSESPWRELRFSLPGKHAWQYRVELTGEDGARWAEARANLDCKGDVRIVRVKVRADSKEPLEVVKE